MSDTFDPGPGWREVQPSEAKGGSEYLKHNTADTVQVWVREAPVPALPTDLYTVIRVSGRPDYDSPIFVLRPGGEWCNALDAMFLSPSDLRDSITSFAVLSEPRAVTAKAVLEHVRREYNDDDATLRKIATEFGVES